MSWLRDDDDMLDHEKWRRALRDGGDGALLVWARLRAWCSRRLTDGLVPADMVDEVAEIGRSKARARALRALVEHGLCARRVDGALTIVGYLERNPSRAKVLEERDRRSEAQRKRRLGESVTGHAPTSEPERNEVPARPGPIPSPFDPTTASAPAPSPPVIRVVPGKGRFAPEDFEPSELQRVRCQELRFDVVELVRRFKLQEFNRDYTDWGKRFSLWIEAEKLERETRQAHPSLARASPRPAGSDPNERLRVQAERVQMLRAQEASEEARQAGNQ